MKNHDQEEGEDDGRPAVASGDPRPKDGEFTEEQSEGGGPARQCLLRPVAKAFRDPAILSRLTRV